MKHKLIVTAMVALLAGLSQSSEARTRTVCGSVKFKDYRNGCSGDGTHLTGRLDPCVGNTGTEMYIRGTFIDVYDYDSGGGTDEYIGKWYVPTRGSFCLTFEWENAAYSLGEANPDVYFVYSDWKWGYGSGDSQLAIMNHNGGGTATVPNAIVWDAAGQRADECQWGSNCWLGSVLLVGSTADDNTLRFLMGDSGKHTLDQYGDDSHDPQILDLTARYEPNCNNHPISWSATSFRVCDAYADDMWVVPHEMGHHYLRQTLWGGATIGPWSYTACGGADNHTITSVECDRVATEEGWCDYIAARSWWDPENSSSVPYLYGRDFEDSTPVDTSACNSANRGIELLVARGFWDLDDANQDTSGPPVATYTDYTNYDSLSDIAAVWADFATGTGDRQIGEGTNDYHGANLWDYWVNGSAYWSDQNDVVRSLISMQCQYYMDYN